MQYLSMGHSIFIGEEGFEELKKLLRKEYTSEKIIVLLDENILQHCWPILIQKIPQLNKAEIIEIESGEQGKDLDIAANIWKVLTEFRVGRKGLIINFGGGVISDLGGFVASVYKRGIKFVHIPTTLLSQVDASIGGKTGINFLKLKNQIGTFSFPLMVIVWPGFLKTLGRQHVMSGFAEMIKHGLIARKSYWNKLRKIDLTQLDEIVPLIPESIKIKNTIIKSDPTESDLRKALNFGHTIGHALEEHSFESSGSDLLHGEAVALGIICESYLSYKKRGITKEALTEISEFISRNFQPLRLHRNDYHRLIELMKYDKKVIGNEIRFTLINGIGQAKINQKAKIEHVLESFDFMAKLPFK